MTVHTNPSTPIRGSRTMIKLSGKRWRSTRAVRDMTGWAAALALFVPVLACSSLSDALKVVSPDNIETGKLTRPENAQILVNGAIGDFECALGSFIVAGGLMSGELMDGTSTAARWTLDRRAVDPSETLYASASCQGLGTYTPISVARFTADNALTLLQGWTDAEVPKRTSLIAQAAAYSGYSRILLGEAFCNAAIAGSAQLTSAQIFAQAEERFTTAIAAAQASGNTAMLNMAYVGRARARLDQGNTAGALADAQQVPAGFVINATADLTTPRRLNRVQDQNTGRAVSVAPAYRGLTVTNASGVPVPDTRVTVNFAGRNAADNATPLYLQTKYATGASPIPIASGDEAQLIIAEVQGGQTAVSIINALRAKAGLPAYQSTDNTAIANQVIVERSRELFLEGQHLYDVRRLNLPLVPAAGLPYSTVYAKGGAYGTERCLPIPNVEVLNNPAARPAGNS